MSNLSTEALSMATKLAAEQLKKSNHDIKLLKETVATQATAINDAATQERAFKLATKLVVGEDVLTNINEKAASLLREDLDIVEKAMDLGLSQGLKLGHVPSKVEPTKSGKAEDRLIDFLYNYSNGDI